MSPHPIPPPEASGAVAYVSSSSSNDTDGDDWSGVIDPEVDVADEDGGGEWHGARLGLYDEDPRGADDSADDIVWDMSENNIDARF